MLHTVDSLGICSVHHSSVANLTGDAIVSGTMLMSLAAPTLSTSEGGSTAVAGGGLGSRLLLMS
jgi:hypothetical protein